MTLHADKQNSTSILLRTVGTQSTKHLQAVEIDLQQINGLLHEAIAALVGHFTGLQDAVAQRRMLTDCLVSTGHTEKDTSQLAAIDAVIAHHTQGAITALQFEDMARQLNESSVIRIAGLKQALLDIMLADSGNSTIPAIEQQFQKQSESLDQTISKSVHQTHVKSGEIELF